MKNFLVWVFIWAFVIEASGQAEEGSEGWKEALKANEAELLVYWHTSRPFIHRSHTGQLEGIEHDILVAFQTFVQERYGIILTYRWVETPHFSKVLEWTTESSQPGVIGLAAISKTPGRAEVLAFSPTYMSDFSVIVSSADVPLVDDLEEFNNLFDTLSAITIVNTTYETNLMKLKESQQLSFDFQYIHSSDNILQTLKHQKASFGYVDLPIYLMEFNKNPNLNINRQNFFPVKGEGLSLVLPLGSDWQEPIDAFFQDSSTSARIREIIGHYINYDIYDFIESQYENDYSLLNKERQIHNRQLTDQAMKLHQESMLRSTLLAFIIVIMIFAIVLIYLYNKSIKTSRKLGLQQVKILEQRKSIEEKQQQLEKRNMSLTALNDEKNNLIRILAHDLRTPINHIIGLTTIVTNESTALSEKHRQMLEQVMESSERLNNMIVKVLDVDAIEENRVNLVEEPVEVNTVVKKVVIDFKLEMERKKISVKTDFSKAPLYMYGDSLFLTEIVENLVSNAVKFTHLYGEIQVAVRSTKDFVRISIADQGPGILVEDMPKLFKKFQRLTAQPTAGESSIGLGLSIVKRYVEMMHGEVYCESPGDRGATFYVDFPLHNMVYK